MSATFPPLADVHVVQAVEKSEGPGPIPPFLSRAGSRVFSLSNMLRSNDLSLHSHLDNSKAMSPCPVDASPTPVGSPGGYMPLSRAASMKGAKLFGDVSILLLYFCDDELSLNLCSLSRTLRRVFKLA